MKKGRLVVKSFKQSSNFQKKHNKVICDLKKKAKKVY